MRGRATLSDVSVCGRFVFQTLQILAIDQALDALLNHVDVGDEARGQLGENLVHQAGVTELLPLSISVISKCEFSGSMFSPTYFIMRTMAASILPPRSSFIFFSVSLR